MILSTVDECILKEKKVVLFILKEGEKKYCEESKSPPTFNAAAVNNFAWHVLE